jgi:serine/threonine-protein kinase CHEK2
MHSKQVCHRDIKLDNIIYNSETSIVKIIDMGFAGSSRDPLKSFCGTPSYIAPEIVAHKGSEYQGCPVDMWAAGVALYVLLTGLFPFKANDEKALYKKI